MHEQVYQVVLNIIMYMCFVIKCLCQIQIELQSCFLTFKEAGVYSSILKLKILVTVQIEKN